MGTALGSCTITAATISVWRPVPDTLSEFRWCVRSQKLATARMPPGSKASVHCAAVPLLQSDLMELVQPTLSAAAKLDLHGRMSRTYTVLKP